MNMFGYGDVAAEEMIELMHRFSKVSYCLSAPLGGAEFLEKNLKDNRLEPGDGELYLEMHQGTFTTRAT